MPPKTFAYLIVLLNLSRAIHSVALFAAELQHSIVFSQYN
jgi:hypothetical protein